MLTRRGFFALVAGLPALRAGKRKPIAEDASFVIVGNGNTFINCRFFAVGMIHMDPEEAFISAGRPRFDRAALEDHWQLVGEHAREQHQAR